MRNSRYVPVSSFFLYFKKIIKLKLTWRQLPIVPLLENSEPNIPPYVNRNIIDEQKSNYGNTTQADLGASMEAHGQAVKDQVDGAVVTGPKRADQSSGGRVQVGEQGDLHDLAARRQP
jgi:hypothetical protein